jgi:hypothetical protein
MKQEMVWIDIQRFMEFLQRLVVTTGQVENHSQRKHDQHQPVDYRGPKWRDLFQRCHEPIAALGNRLYEFLAIGPFAQSLAQERNMRNDNISTLTHRRFAAEVLTF